MDLKNLVDVATSQNDDSQSQPSSQNTSLPQLPSKPASLPPLMPLLNQTQASMMNPYQQPLPQQQPQAQMQDGGYVSTVYTQKRYNDEMDENSKRKKLGAEAEKQRRNAINVGFRVLQDKLPPNDGGHETKARMLHRAAEYISMLEATVRQQEEKLRRPLP